jgi:hypothetical protein
MLSGMPDLIILELQAVYAQSLPYPMESDDSGVRMNLAMPVPGIFSNASVFQTLVLAETSSQNAANSSHST